MRIEGEHGQNMKWIGRSPEPREDARSEKHACRIMLEMFSVAVKFLDPSSFACGQSASLVKFSGYKSKSSVSQTQFCSVEVEKCV